MSTDWDNHYATGDMPWEKGRPHPALVDFLAKLPMRGRVLVPGCGLGHDVRAIAASADEVIGLDVSTKAIELANQHPEVGGERYMTGDFLSLPRIFGGAFDWLFEHTCFCAINPADRQNYVRSAWNALKPGARFLGIFYLNPDMDPGEEGPPFGVTPEELDRWFGDRFELEAEWVPENTYEGREQRELCRLYRRLD